MAAREVIRFRFDTQAVRRVCSITPKPSFLFEHSPPSSQPAQSFPRCDPHLHITRRRVPWRLTDRLPYPASVAGGKEGFECERPICTKQFSW